MQERTTRILRIALLASLLVWGAYTLFVYLGVPVHLLVLVTPDDKGLINQSCAETAYFCAGWRALMPTISYTLSRALPFLTYALISLACIAGLYLRGYLKDGEARVRLTLRPWMLVVAFLGCAWLLFTTLSFTGNGEQSFRRMYEPIPQVYTGAGPEALQTLKENFDRLQARNCLTHVGQTTSGAQAYDLKGSCIQSSFITRVLPQMLLVGFLLFVFLALGRLLLSLGRVRPETPLLEFLVSVCVGACGMIFLLWLLALASLYTATSGWVLLIVVVGLSWRHALYWLQRFIKGGWEIDVSWKSGVLLLGWLLLSYLALNFLNVVRPFPIGWDDLGRYINQPRLLVSYGHFIPTMPTFQWEYLTSLGFLLFGYDSVFGATGAMMINWSQGLLAVLVVFAFTRTFLGKGRGVLAALLYYALPLVGHFSFADMKVDNAVFTMGAMSTLCAFLALFPAMTATEDEEGDGTEPTKKDVWKWLILAGVFAGFAFSFKPTSIMLILSTLAVILGSHIGWLGLAGGFFLTWAIYAFQGQINLKDILGRIGFDPSLLSRTTFGGIAFILGAGALAYAAVALDRTRVLRGLKLAGILVASTAVTILPWLINNNIQNGNLIPRIEFGVPNRITPSIQLSQENIESTGQKIVKLPEDLKLDLTNAACVSTSKTEELDRYWGFGKGWSHYLTLPWRAVMNIDSAGYYVTLFPALLLVPLILLLPYAWSRRGRWALWLFAATMLTMLQWIVFANGIPWYGLGMFLGLCILLEVLFARSPDTATKTTAGVLIGLSLVTAFGMRLWQYEQQSNLFEYPIGKVSADAMRERTIPDYDDIRQIVMDRFESMPDRPYVYRVGTFIPYFIPHNLEVLPLADHQLDTFNCLYQERDPALTLKRMQALGFNSVIFDTNTHTIEQDPQGSLHKKVNSFVEFLNDPTLGLRIIVNDPGNGIAYILLP